MIDSLYDIAVNKLQAIVSNPRGRDYVDLFCILKKTDWTIQSLLGDVIVKFSISSDPIRLAKNFLKVVEYTDVPKMLIPFNRNDVDTFYADLARSLRNEVFR